MGTWDIMPWDDDAAGDWYADFMKRTKIRDHIITALKLDPEDNAGEVRAAISIFIMLGRVYIWPIESFDKDLNLVIISCKALLELQVFTDAPEILSQIQLELSELESRQQKPKSGTEDKRPRPWWKPW